MSKSAIIAIFAEVELEVLAFYGLVIHVVGVALFLLGVDNHRSGFRESLAGLFAFFVHQ